MVLHFLEDRRKQERRGRSARLELDRRGEAFPELISHNPHCPVLKSTVARCIGFKSRRVVGRFTVHRLYYTNELLSSGARPRIESNWSTDFHRWKRCTPVSCRACILNGRRPCRVLFKFQMPVYFIMLFSSRYNISLPKRRRSFSLTPPAPAASVS